MKISFKQAFCFLFATIFLLSCAGNKTDDQFVSRLVSDNSEDTYKTGGSESNDTIILRELISKEFNEWINISGKQLDTISFKRYISSGAAPDIIYADFNCDGLSDFAVLLQSADSTEILKGIGLFIFWNNGYTFKPQHIDAFSRSENSDYSFVPIAIYKIKNGLLFHNGRDEGVDIDSPFTIDCPGISLIYFEKSSRVYYYNRDCNCMQWVWTGC